MNGPEAVKQIADAVGGKIEEMGRLPDGSGFATVSMPLPKDHWIYGDSSCEREVGEVVFTPTGNGIREATFVSTGSFEPPPMVFKMGRDDSAVLIVGQSDDPNDAGLDVEHGVTMTRQGFAEQIRRAGKYAVRATTMNGKDTDLDPDALLQNLVVGFLGYWTKDGLSKDEWANPETR